MRSKAEFKLLNSDEDSTVALKEKYGIRGIPSLIYTDSSGKEVSRSGGFGSAEQFIDHINGLTR